MSNLKYRPDIDGLRAIAVLSVVIFHINPNWLPSGFLGVDIFFVLSGFLITSIIYREMLEDRFSFKEFYIRRIKRILPLFFVTLITGLLVSWYVFLPGDTRRVAQSGIASLLFLANRYFARQGGYFDVTMEEKPFLHIWSLSVEEQFYFLFPIVLILILKIPFLKRNLLKTLGLVLVLLLFSAFLDLKKIGIYWDTYYLSHTRFGEILIGSFLAVYREEKRKEEKSGRDYLGLILFLVLLSCFFLDKIFVSPYFPGVLALIPCGVTALLIYFNEQKTWVSAFLSLKPIVWLGKISYSLYLWHWVVLAVMRYVYQESEMPWQWNLVAIILMMGLSVMTYYWVENPIRKLKLSFEKNLVYFYIIPVILVTGIIMGLLNRKDEREAGMEFRLDNICHNKINGNCIKGDVNKKPKLLFIGNSFIGHLNPWIDKVGKAEGWSATVISSSKIQFLYNKEGWIEHHQTNLTRDEYNSLVARDDFFMKHYKEYPIIVFHYNEGDDEDFHQRFLETLKKLTSEGKKVYVITSVVRTKINIHREKYLSQRGLSFRKLEIKRVDNHTGFIPDNLGIRKVDLTEYFPKSFYIDGKTVMADISHWNTFGSEKMAEIFLSKGKRFIKKEDLE